MRILKVVTNFFITFFAGCALGACIVTIFYSRLCKKWEKLYTELTKEYSDSDGSRINLQKEEKINVFCKK